ncbi:MAG: zinc metallopeptidase [Oscillospiraceae bacterium]|nr:zinc metallopeptidase [Oscillospiraceae bacterium]
MIWYGIPILSIILILIAQIGVKSAFRKYSEMQNSAGLTGAEAARQMLLDNGITDVQIEHISGSLTDHYDPRANVIRLSEDVYNKSTVAAVGVAMHEAGHALQYAQGYKPVVARNAIVKSTNVSSWASYLLVVVGCIFSSPKLITVGIWFFLVVIAFQLITLPVEFNASGRALRTLNGGGFLTVEEQKGVRKVLTAAAMTYVVAVVNSLLQLIRLLAIRNSRR